MALSIDHRGADELARRLAAEKRETECRTAPHLQAELRAISDRCAALPDYDTRTCEEIVGFDEHGIPT